jgi:alkane 1-monooxygenase
MKQILLFAASALVPLAAFYMTLVVALADQLLPRMATPALPDAEFPAANALLAVIGFSALAMLPYGVHALVTQTGHGVATRLAGGVALGLWLGQVAVPAAHELIHRGSFRFVRLGVAIYTVLLFGHPNTARDGEGFYRFFRRAWMGSFRAGLAAEDRLRRERQHLRGWSSALHPYLVYLGGALAALAFGYALAGWTGVAVWAALAVHAQSQLLLSDYVQHYGLIRERLPDGTLAPHTAAHSWNAAHWLSGHVMLNAARHSDHHLNPARTFPALRLPPVAEAPRLPWSLPMACTLALVPPLWQLAMAPHLARARAASAPAPVAKP